MITLDMTRKGLTVAVDEQMFTLEHGIKTLQISLGTYNLTGKAITAVFDKTQVETGLLMVEDNLIKLPIAAGYVRKGVNYIQLNICKRHNPCTSKGITCWESKTLRTRHSHYHAHSNIGATHCATFWNGYMGKSTL